MENVEEQLGWQLGGGGGHEEETEGTAKGEQTPFVSQIPSKAVFDKLLYTAWMWIHTEPLMRARWWKSPLNEV